MVWDEAHGLAKTPASSSKCAAQLSPGLLRTLCAGETETSKVYDVRKAKGDAHFCASPLVDHDLKLSNFYADYCRLLKFIEYWEQDDVI